MLLTETERTIYVGLAGQVPTLIYKSFDVFGEDEGNGVSKLEPVKRPKSKLSLWDDGVDEKHKVTGRDILNQTFGIFSKITKVIQDNLVEEKGPGDLTVSLKIFEIFETFILQLYCTILVY